MILEKKYRFDNLEFRWVESNYHPPYPEIVCWQKGSDEKEFCYTLALWVEGSEGWALKFVGNRPFDKERVDSNLFWELARFGDTVANAEWELKQVIRER
jgi:hypothetical protein